MSFEFTFINPPGDSISNDDENNQFAGNCDLFAVDNTTMTGADTLVITCFNDFLPTTPTPTPTDDESGIHIVPSGGATLTYVMTQEQEQGQQQHTQQQQNRLMQQQQSSQQTQEQEQQDDVKTLN